MITNKIAYWRSTMNEGRGITRAHLARRIGVGRSFVSKLEKGTAKPGAELMLRVAQYLKQPVEAIFQQVNDGDTNAAIFRATMIPDRQLPNKPLAACLSRPVSSPFPDAHPPVSGETIHSAENEKNER